jgi:MFS family permease
MSSVVEPADGLPLPQRRWAILTIALGIVMAVLDGAIANVALPTIAADLNASPAFSVWIVNGYQLAITISLLPLASLGEIVGYRRVYLAGLVLFTVASALCALSHTLLLLTLARIVQGFGAAGIMSVNTALVRFIYPHAQLGRGIAINALVVAIAAAVGPTVAAAILAVGTWPYLFAINLPVAIVALALGWHCLPHTRRASHTFDWQSAALSAVTFGFGIAAIDSIGHGEAALFILAEFAIAVVAGVLLVLRQTHATSPLLPVDLLRIPIFALSISTSIASFCAQMLAFVAIPFYLQSHFGYSAVQTGLLITPWPIAVAFRGADRRTSGRALPGRPARGNWTLPVRRRAYRLGAAARTSFDCRPDLAHGARRRGFRPVPDAQQPHHDRGRPARAQRRRQRHAGDGKAVGTDHRRSPGCPVPGTLSGRGPPDFPRGCGGFCCAGRSAQHAEIVTGGRERRGAGARPGGTTLEGRLTVITDHPKALGKRKRPAVEPAVCALNERV